MQSVLYDSYDTNKHVSDSTKELVRSRFQPTISFVETYLRNVVIKVRNLHIKLE